MLERLGIVLYVISIIAAFLWVVLIGGFIIATGEFDFAALVVIFLPAGVIVLIGRAILYILAGGADE